MANRKLKSKGGNFEGTVRATISFIKSHYMKLEKIAELNNVSVAWVVRDAVDKYLISTNNKQIF